MSLGAAAATSSVDNVFPSCNPTGFTLACQPHGGSFSAFPGKYTLALKIGDRTFDDKVTINYMTRHPGMLNSAEVLAGEFYSPEAKLFSPLISGRIVLTSVPPNHDAGFEMAFEISVIENARRYRVYFTVIGSSLKSCKNEGVAYLDAAKTKVMGTFTMTKDTTDCSCGL